MSNDKYDELSLEELEKIYREQLKNDIRKAGTNKLNVSADMNMSQGETNKLAEYYRRYVKSTGYDTAFEYTNSDDGCDTDVSAWSPSENFVRAIWHGVYAKANLLEVAVKGLDISAGKGNIVNIRTIGKFGDPVELSSCECASCSSLSLSDYSIALKQYGLGTVICGFEEWDVGYDLYSKSVEALAKSYANFISKQIYAELTGATAGYTKDLDNALSCSPSIGGSCCTDTSLLDMYNSVNDVVAYMRGQDYEPDYMIMHPTVAAILKRMQSPSVQSWAESIISLDVDGRISRFNGLKVIEYSGASSCTDASGSHMAIIIDSSRAVGAAFGKHPFIKREDSASCNSVELYMWMYFNASELDTGAIAHIENP